MNHCINTGMDTILTTKYCLGCQQDKTLNLFWKNKRSADGLDRYCVDCGKARRKKDYEDNKDKYLQRVQQYQQRPEFKEQHKKYQQTWLTNGGDVWMKEYQQHYCEQHKEKRVRVSKEWYEQHPESLSDIQLRYRINNRGVILSRLAKRRAQKKQAIPPWFEKEAVEALYKQCKLKSIQEGKNYHVDHIIPINNTDVCGLHCLDNLQILTAEENMSKSNKLIDFSGE